MSCEVLSKYTLSYPWLSPGVSDNPIFNISSIIHSPTDDRNQMVDLKCNTENRHMYDKYISNRSASGCKHADDIIYDDLYYVNICCNNDGRDWLFNNISMQNASSQRVTFYRE